MLKTVKDKIICVVLDDGGKTEQGLFLPETSKKDYKKIKVVEMGPDVSDAVNTDDRLIVSGMQGAPFKVDGVEHLVITEDQILFISEDEKITC